MGRQDRFYPRGRRGEIAKRKEHEHAVFTSRFHWRRLARGGWRHRTRLLYDVGGGGRVGSRADSAQGGLPQAGRQTPDGVHRQRGARRGEPERVLQLGRADRGALRRGPQPPRRRREEGREEVPEGAPLPGLARSARQGEGPRRRGRLHARPHARRLRHRGDGARLPRVRGEAARAHLVGGRALPRGGESLRSRHADGQQRQRLGRPAPQHRDPQERRPRRGARDPRHDEPSDLAAGAQAPGRSRHGSRDAGLEPLARRGAEASVQAGRVPHVQVAPSGAAGSTSARARWATSPATR